MSTKSVIVCDECGHEIVRDDPGAFGVAQPDRAIRIARVNDYRFYPDDAHICGEACLHVFLSRLLPNLL